MSGASTGCCAGRGSRLEAPLAGHRHRCAGQARSSGGGGGLRGGRQPDITEDKVPGIRGDVPAGTGGIMIWQIMSIMLGSFGIGAVLMAFAGSRVPPNVRRRRWLKFAGYLVIVTVVLGCAAMGRSWLAGLVLLITATGAWELQAAG